MTGSKSTLYEYDRVGELTIEKVYDENGQDNDQEYFVKLLRDTNRAYDTAIVFGDDDNPGQSWYNVYNQNTSRISDDKGKEICNWKVNNLISFHTSINCWEYKPGETLAGYGRWFSPEKITCIEDWVKDMGSN
ncbi:MAG: hypothetical protein ACI8WT_004734 [Clostridium sp.]